MARANRHHIPGQVRHINHRLWVQEAISNGENQREGRWTESIVADGIGFVEETKARLGITGMGRKIAEQEADRFVLREESEPHGSVSDPEKRVC